MNTKRNLIVILTVFFAINAFSQKNKDVLLTINDQPIYASEFKTVFNKNLDLVIDEEQKNVDGYMDLFIDYKLKITEAYAQGLDKNPSYIKEFTKYQDQLSKSYIYDSRISSELMQEAYDRGLEEVNADHLLIKVSLNARPEDTLIAYNKIKTLRNKVVNGEDFEELIKKYSEEPGAKTKGGKLGYFSVFQMVYSFENAAYTTKIGDISEIIRTQFGYHILKVNDRRIKQPKIKVAHIMIFDNEKKKNEHAEEKINEIYALLMQGESFGSLAKQFSDDKNSAIRDGNLKPFGHGDLRAPEFERVAFSLTEKDQISAPVKSSFGWHIIKFEEIVKEPTFEEIKSDLEKKVTSGDRAKVVTQAVNSKIKDKYGYKEGVSYSPFFKEFVTDSIFKRKWDFEKISTNNDLTLFTIGNSEIKFNDFANFIKEKQNAPKRYTDKEVLLFDYYSEFFDKKLMDYYKEKLEVDNKEYANTLNEYRYGLLIFDAMDKNIWTAAKLDTIGLKNYYTQTKSNYQWKKRIDAVILSSTKESTANQVKELLAKGVDIEEIKKQLNTDGIVNVIITNNVYEIDNSHLPTSLDIKLGVSEIIKREDSFVVVKINEIIEPTTKEFDEVRGMVLSDYQKRIEENWMKELREKYEVKINKKVLKRIKKDLIK